MHDEFAENYAQALHKELWIALLSAKSVHPLVNKWHLAVGVLTQLP